MFHTKLLEKHLLEQQQQQQQLQQAQQEDQRSNRSLLNHSARSTSTSISKIKISLLFVCFVITVMMMMMMMMMMMIVLNVPKFYQKKQNSSSQMIDVIETICNRKTNNCDEKINDRNDSRINFDDRNEFKFFDRIKSKLIQNQSNISSSSSSSSLSSSLSVSLKSRSRIIPPLAIASSNFLANNSSIKKHLEFRSLSNESNDFDRKSLKNIPIDNNEINGKKINFVLKLPYTLLNLILIHSIYSDRGELVKSQIFEKEFRPNDRIGDSINRTKIIDRSDHIIDDNDDVKHGQLFENNNQMFQKYHFVSELESENENNDEDDDSDGMGDRSYDYDDYDDNYDDSKQQQNQKQSLQSTLISSIFNDFDGHQIRNIFVVILYGVIMVISLCGNSIVCYVIYMTPKLQTTTNILIFSLTISDILTTIFNIPFNCARFLLQNYPFPNLFCILMPTIQITSVYVSTLTMAAIGLHRYRSIRDCSKLNIWIPIRNFNRIACSMTSYRIKLWIVFIWFISILLALPHSLFNKVVIVAIKQNNPTIVHRCRAVYPVSIEQQMPLMLSLLTTLTQFLLPLGFTSVLYARIGRIIAHQGRITRHYCDHTNRRIIEAKRKRIKMLILIVFCFLITWLPLTVYHLLIDFHLVHFYWNLFLMLHIWAMTSLCYNPFIYCLMNDDFLRLSTDSVPKILKWILICASTSTTTSMVRVDCNRMIKSNPTMTTTTVSDRINDE